MSLLPSFITIHTTNQIIVIKYLYIVIQNYISAIKIGDCKHFVYEPYVLRQRQYERAFSSFYSVAVNVCDATWRRLEKFIRNTAVLQHTRIASAEQFQEILKLP